MNHLAYLVVFFCLFNVVNGGKLMDKVFQCDAKMREEAKRSNVAKPKHIKKSLTFTVDKATRERENIAKAEANLNKHYFQGDMMLTPDQQKVINRALVSKQKSKYSAKRAMIKDMAKLWPTGTVPYTFAETVDDEGKQVALAAMKHWKDHTCVKFVERSTENDYVDFQFGDGCASRVGRLGGKQEILIGSIEFKCKVGNLIHELGHTLGFFHEHSRPDRDNYVSIAWSNVKDGFDINFQKLPAEFIDSRDVAYDYGSIMHYPRTIFGKNPLLETVIIKDRNVQVGQRIKLSDLDILQAKKLYGCGGISSKSKN